jgi:CubicO group peptidase (beta-lactamase class C family)
MMEKKMVLTRVRKCFVLIAVLSLCAPPAAVHLAPARAEELDQSAWPTKGWLTSTPEEQGMDSSELATLVDFGGSHSFDSLLVVRHGRIVTEATYAPYTAAIPHDIHSCTKAIISTLVGMIHKDGQLQRLDRPVLDVFNDRNIANVDDRKKAVTIQNLLDMTSGLDWDEGFEGGKEQSVGDLERSSDWSQFILDRPMAHAPGESFYYNSGNPHLLSAIITKLTGKAAEDYAKEKLFGPLGIATWRWDHDPQGISTGGWGLVLLPRDMAKIGYLYLRHGEWDGRQLLPPGWADILSHTTVNMHASYDPNQRYSNLFWVFPGGRVFMANSWHGQNIAVFPGLDIVAVVTAHKYVSQFALIEGIYAAVKSESALPPNPSAAQLLASAINDASAEKHTAVGLTPEIASTISGKVYKFTDNDLKLKSLSLLQTDPHPQVEFEIYSHDSVTSSVKHDEPIGLDGLYRTGSPLNSGPAAGYVTATKGTWLNGQKFLIDLQVPAFGEQRKYLLSFSREKLHLRFEDGDGRVVSLDGEQGD